MTRPSATSFKFPSQTCCFRLSSMGKRLLNRSALSLRLFTVQLLGVSLFAVWFRAVGLPSSRLGANREQILHHVEQFAVAFGRAEGIVHLIVKRIQTLIDRVF